MAEPAGGDDVERRLAELDELLARVEQLPGPGGELALEAVAAVVEIYGAAISRALLLARSPEAFSADPLLGHLLLVHGMHPDPVDVRVRRALGGVGERVPGADLELLGITAGTARVRVTAVGGCGAPAPEELEQALREVLLAAAPELAAVETVTAEAPRTAAFIPLDSLVRRVPA